MFLISRIELEKKDSWIIILSIAFIASIILQNYLVFWPTNGSYYPISRIKLEVGTSGGPSDLDPVRSWDSKSNDVIEQVCEGLYHYNLSDPNLGIIPMLAADYGTWDITGTEFTVPLRRNVWFHDGTPFNAEAVKWNFERINWFINASGTLNTSIGISRIHSLYEFPNGTTILDPTTPVTVNSDYSVTINLRAPYAILESLLCYVTAYMLSPTSTLKKTYIETATGDLVGTGPFVYDYYIDDTEVKFHRWDRYWRTGAYFEEVTFGILEDSTIRYNAIKGHTIDYLIGSSPSFISSNYSDPTHTSRSDIGSLTYYYLGMNNKKINRTWRQAISYAINYTYIVDEILDSTVFRSNGPLAPDFPGYNASIKAANWDLAYARSLVQSMSLGTGLIADNDTTGVNALAWRASSLQSWEYWNSMGNVMREDIGILLADNLDLIGIDVIFRNWNPFEFIPNPLDFYSMELYWIGWEPDYLSPYNMIVTLFSNQSAYNFAQYHNHNVEMWLDEVLLETNATKRAELYSKILHQIVEEDMPHAFGYHPYQHIIHSADIIGVPYNALGSFYAYPMHHVKSRY